MYSVELFFRWKFFLLFYAFNKIKLNVNLHWMLSRRQDLSRFFSFLSIFFLKAFEKSFIWLVINFISLKRQRRKIVIKTFFSCVYSHENEIKVSKKTTKKCLDIKKSPNFLNITLIYNLISLLINVQIYFDEQPTTHKKNEKWALKDKLIWWILVRW